jgi:hypothetical protein
MGNGFPMKQIKTGQKFPEGIRLEDGQQCDQCGRKGKTAIFDIRPVGWGFPIAIAPDADVHVIKILCAECMADFVAAPMCRVFGTTTTGEEKEIKALPK